MAKHIAVIAAHPDDELLGCGGTIAKHSRQGDAVHVLIACEGESLRYGSSGANQQSHIHDAAAILGVHSTQTLGLPDQRLDAFTLTDIIRPIESFIAEVKPSVVYCQYGGDLNMDHKLLFEAVMVATRPLQESIRAVYAFYTVSSTEWSFPRSFVPDTWVDISSTLDAKLKAFECYKSEIREYPHPRSSLSLRYNAYAFGSQCVMKAAEVFMTVRRTMRNDETPS